MKEDEERQKVIEELVERGNKWREQREEKAKGQTEQRQQQQRELRLARARSHGVNRIVLFAVCLATLVAMIGIIISKWAELTGVSWNRDVIVLQASSGSSVWLSVLVIFASVATAGELAAAVLYLPREIRGWWHRRRVGLSVVIFLLVATPPFTLWMIGYAHAWSVDITIDKSSKVMNVEKHYLFRSEQRIQILFSEIDHIAYQYSSGGTAPGQPSQTVSASGRTKVIKVDGVSINISSGEPKPQRELATAIARATGKPLISGSPRKPERPQLPELEIFGPVDDIMTGGDLPP